VQEMKIALRAALARYRLAPADQGPERTRRRGITFSPARQATVVLRVRERTPHPVTPLLANA